MDRREMDVRPCAGNGLGRVLATLLAFLLLAVPCPALFGDDPAAEDDAAPAAEVPESPDGEDESPENAAPEATAPDAGDDEDIYELQKLLVDTIHLVESSYVEPIERRKLVEAAIRGVLEELDPYSNYIAPENMRRFEQAIEDEYGGIGVRVQEIDGEIVIVTPLADSPALEAGVKAGDVILEVDGESIEGQPLDEVIQRTLGDVGSEVLLRLRRANGKETYTATLERRTIEIETVLGRNRDRRGEWRYYADAKGKIGYIRVASFSRQTSRELRKVVAELKEDGLRGLVLDLRFNPGGMLSTAIEICDLFVADGTIVSVKGRDTPERTWEATRRGTFDDFPMVVLVNGYSASASEVTSACLQDHARAVVIGERTWGKGSVQNIIRVENGASALKLTTAGYHRPSGKNIHRLPSATEDDEWGVMPDEGYRVKLKPEETSALMEDMRRREIIGPKTGGRRSPSRDQQLETALDYLHDRLKESADVASTDDQVAPASHDQPVDAPNDDAVDAPAP